MTYWKRATAGLFGWIVILASLGWLEATFPGQEQNQQQAKNSPLGDVDLRSADDRIADYTLWLERLTGVLAVSTIGLWYVTWRTLEHARRDAARQASDMRASISAANTSAGAAQDALRHARESSQRQLRAYINVAEARFDDIEVGKAPNARIKIQNYGQTPAYNLRQAAIMGFQKFPLEDSPPPLVDGAAFPETPIAPTGHVYILPSLKDPINQVEMDQLLSGEYALFAVGEVHYTDCFGIKRFTKYCHFTGGRMGDKSVVPFGHSAPYITGNECN